MEINNYRVLVRVGRVHVCAHISAQNQNTARPLAIALGHCPHCSSVNLRLRL